MDDILQIYASGMSITQVSEATGIPKSTVRNRLKAEGVLRTRKQSLRLAASQGRLSHAKGKKRKFTAEHKAAISAGRKRWADENAAGVSVKQNGYVEYTMGPNKFRSVHVVVMEEKIGRRLRKGECVHHKDGDKQNNDISNLQLMTVSEHTKLHRLQDAQQGKTRDRGKNGRFC